MPLSIGNDNTIPPGEKSDQRQSLHPGDTLGQYKVVHLLGRGGMGEVYKVEHTTLEKHFALKLLPEEFAQNRNALERLRRWTNFLISFQIVHSKFFL